MDKTRHDVPRTQRGLPTCDEHPRHARSQKATPSAGQTAANPPRATAAARAMWANDVKEPRGGGVPLNAPAPPSERSFGGDTGGDIANLTVKPAGAAANAM